MMAAPKEAQILQSLLNEYLQLQAYHRISS